MPQTEPELIAPLIRQGWIKAAIIPATDTLTLELQSPENSIHPKDILQYSGKKKHSMNTPLPTEISEFQQEQIQQCLPFFNTAGYDDGEIQCWILAYQPNVTTSLEPKLHTCLLYTSPSPRDQRGSRMPSSA